MKKKRKNNTKVKKSRVKSSKKKKNNLRKKNTKKKVYRKKIKKTAKIKKRRRKKKISMEDIYSIINRVQINKKTVTFATNLLESSTIENTIKDVNLEYKKIEMKTQIIFTIFPNEEKYEDEKTLHFEIMDDEIPDIGQIFG